MAKKQATKTPGPDGLREVRVLRPCKTPGGLSLRPGHKARLKPHVIEALGNAVEAV